MILGNLRMSSKIGALCEIKEGPICHWKICPLVNSDVLVKALGENRKMRNNIINIVKNRKTSLTSYFVEYCEKHEESVMPIVKNTHPRKLLAAINFLENLSELPIRIYLFSFIP